jgi:hypothetical protein
MLRLEIALANMGDAAKAAADGTNRLNDALRRNVGRTAK